MNELTPSRRATGRTTHFIGGKWSEVARYVTNTRIPTLGRVLKPKKIDRLDRGIDWGVEF